MRLWPFGVVLVVSLAAGGVYFWLHQPPRDVSNPAGRELPRLPLDRIEAPLPPRFSGPLPTRVEGFRQELEKGPPLSYVRARLLEGDPQMGEKFLSALRQMEASAQGFDELWATYGPALGLSEGESLDDMEYLKGIQDEGVPCAWLRERLSERTEEQFYVRELFWRKLVRCPGPESEALFARDDAPVKWVLQHHALFGRPRFTPALEKALRRILAANRQELFPKAEIWVSDRPEPAARELDAEFWSKANATAKAAMREIAERDENIQREEEKSASWQCPPIPTRPEGVDIEILRVCLSEWAGSNWAATARFALSAHSFPELQEFAEAFATLTNFPSSEAMKDWARKQGLLPEAVPEPARDTPHLYLSSLMIHAGRGFVVNIREEAFPRRHDDLLVTLAWIVRPELSGVAFEQLPPEHPPAGWGEKPSHEEYTLRAYADGHRFSVKGQNPYSVQDVGAVIGLLNQVLEARGSPHRFAMLDTEVWQVDVVFGPEPALRAADALGLWHLGDGRELLPRIEAHIVRGIRQILGEEPF